MRYTCDDEGIPYKIEPIEPSVTEALSIISSQFEEYQSRIEDQSLELFDGVDEMQAEILEKLDDVKECIKKTYFKQGDEFREFNPGTDEINFCIPRDFTIKRLKALNKLLNATNKLINLYDTVSVTFSQVKDDIIESYNFDYELSEEEYYNAFNEE